MQTEQLLCWSGMRDTEHTTSGSNDEEENMDGDRVEKLNAKT